MKCLLHYIPSLLLAGAIAYLSLLREPHIPPTIRFAYADKWAHLVMYIILSFALIADARRDNLSKRMAAVIALLLPSLYGGLLELLQHFFFYPRTGDWIDWLADVVGALVGNLLACLLFYRTKKTS